MGIAANSEKLVWLKDEADAGGDEKLGFSSDVDGNYAVVGCYEKYDSAAANTPGAILICRLNGTSWEIERIYYASNKADGDGFGYQVAISGPLIAVLAPSKGTDASIYVLERTGDNWLGTINETEITASDAASNDQLGRFGLGIDWSTRTLVAGAAGQDDFGSGSGCLYVWTSASIGSWLERTKLYSSDIAAGDLFGKNPAIYGDTIAAVSLKAFSDGRIYVFRGSGGSWSEEQKIDGANFSGRYFGSALSLDRDRLAVGNPYYSNPDDSMGIVHIIDRTLNTWGENCSFGAPKDHEHGNADFGYDVDVKDDWLAVVARFMNFPPLDDGATTTHGAGFVYDLDEPTTPVFIYPVVAAADGEITELSSCAITRGAAPSVVFGSSNETVIFESVTYTRTGTARFYRIDRTSGIAYDGHGLTASPEGFVHLITDAGENQIDGLGLLVRDYTPVSQCRFRLKCRRGQWPLDPSVGSRFHELKTLKDAQAKCKTYAQEALQPLISNGQITEVSIGDIEVDNRNGRLLAEVLISVPGDKLLSLGLYPLGQP